MDEVMVSDVLKRGRASYAEGAWLDAYESLSRADASDPLEAEDLELLAESAWTGSRGSPPGVSSPAEFFSDESVGRIVAAAA